MINNAKGRIQVLLGLAWYFYMHSRDQSILLCYDDVCRTKLPLKGHETFKNLPVTCSFYVEWHGKVAKFACVNCSILDAIMLYDRFSLIGCTAQLPTISGNGQLSAEPTLKTLICYAIVNMLFESRRTG